ncbi:MAG: hypothetical protein LQ345_001278 [Seirophora villosa]|nr:MAG: hypothetical protein LQ345_001278 [Seirophora villosa]
MAPTLMLVMRSLMVTAAIAEPAEQFCKGLAWVKDEANNTEGHHSWKSDQRLRYSQISFIGAGGSEPNPSTIPQAKDLESAREASPDVSPPHSPLASMKIKEQDETNPSIPCSDQPPGGFSPAVPPGETTLGMKLDQHHPGDRIFPLDDTGWPVAVRKDPVPPKLGRSFSPASSDSSEEVIVFQGRGRALQGCLPHGPPAASKPSAIHDEVRQTLQTKTKYSSSNIVPSYSTAMRSASPEQAQRSAQKVRNVADSGIALMGPATEPSSDSKILFRKGRRSQRWPNRDTLFAVKEDEIFADYIEHIQDDEDLNITLSSPPKDGSSLGNLSTDNESQVDTDDDATASAASSPPARRSKQDPTATRVLNGEIDLDASIDEDSDDTVDDAQIAADLQEHIDEMEDERDLLERKQARMTDEHIARLLSKQEEFGLTSKELFLFDGNDIHEQGESSGEDQDALLFQASVTPKRLRQAGKKRHHRPEVEIRPATLVADMLEEQPYGDFDIMDYDRPSLSRILSGRRNASTFEVPGVGHENSLQLAWEKDRSKKKIRKKEREELRAQGLLGHNSQANLKVKYREGISIDEIKGELQEFMTSTRQSLALPPMANNERRMIHEVAHVLRLKSKSSGQGQARFPVLFKSTRSGDFDAAAIRQIDSLSSSRRFFPRKDVRGQRRSAGLRPRRRNAGNTSGAAYRDGEVVGAAAPEIGEENRGRAMLEKMGWSKGTALGASNNKGMLQPVVHTVKISKAGLG